MATTQIDGGRQIKAATITNAEIATGAAIALSKLAEAVIQADGGQAFTADQSMGGFKLTSLGTPTADGDAATKAYVDALAQGISPKDSVRVATVAAGTLATDFENGDVVDGVTLSTGDRILIKDQASASENGIYTVNASGTPTRATDANTADKIHAAFTFVSEGSTNGDSGWVLTTDAPITLNTTALSFSQFSGAGNITAGDGLTKTGNTINAVGTANRITVSADAIDIGTDVVTLTGAQTLTDKTLTSPVVNSPTGIVKGDVGLGNVDNTSNATERAAAATLTNKTIALGDNSVSGTKAQFDTACSDGNFLYVGDVTQGYVASNFVTRETPSGAVNGSNTSFVLANTPVAGTEHVYLNGILQEPGAGNDYTISGATITYLTAPLTGDKIRVSYHK